MTSTSGRRPPRRSRRRKPAFNQLRIQPNSILVSLTGLIDRSVYDRRGNRVGRVHDLVVALGNGGEHPPLHGIIVRSRRMFVFIPYTAIAGICWWEVFLTTSGLQPHPLPDQNGLVALAGELLDRRIPEADGVSGVRVSDFVLVCMVDEIRLVGADVSIRTLLRRVGTPWMRRRVAIRRVYDWAALGGALLTLSRAGDGPPGRGPARRQRGDW